MINISKHIGEGFAGGELYDILKQLQNMGVGIGGEVYYVDNNAGSDSSAAGGSWETPFKTLSYAITVSNANIAASAHGWASRNTILIKADAMCEDLTVFPAKCDVIGVGSCDAMNKTRIIGEHSDTGDGVIQSTGFYNLEFRNDDASAIFTVTSYSGLYFGDCIFTADADSVNAILTSGSCDNFTIKNCWFRNDEDGHDPFATAAISIVGACYNILIQNNIIEGDIGINIDNAVAYNVVIDNNVIKATTLCIDDESNLAVVTNNTMISAADNGTLGLVFDGNDALACHNYITGSTDTDAYPDVVNLGA